MDILPALELSRNGPEGHGFFYSVMSLEIRRGSEQGFKGFSSCRSAER